MTKGIDKIARKLAQIAMEEVGNCGKEHYRFCHAYLSQLRAQKRG